MIGQWLFLTIQLCSIYIFRKFNFQKTSESLHNTMITLDASIPSFLSLSHFLVSSFYVNLVIAYRKTHNQCYLYMLLHHHRAYQVFDLKAFKTSIWSKKFITIQNQFEKKDELPIIDRTALRIGYHFSIA